MENKTIIDETELGLNSFSDEELEILKQIAPETLKSNEAYWTEIVNNSNVQDKLRNSLNTIFNSLRTPQQNDVIQTLSNKSVEELKLKEPTNTSADEQVCIETVENNAEQYKSEVAIEVAKDNAKQEVAEENDIPVEVVQAVVLKSFDNEELTTEETDILEKIEEKIIEKTDKVLTDFNNFEFNNEELLEPIVNAVNANTIQNTADKEEVISKTTGAEYSKNIENHTKSFAERHPKYSAAAKQISKVGNKLAKDMIRVTYSMAKTTAISAAFGVQGLAVYSAYNTAKTVYQSYKRYKDNSVETVNFKDYLKHLTKKENRVESLSLASQVAATTVANVFSFSSSAAALQIGKYTGRRIASTVSMAGFGIAKGIATAQNKRRFRNELDTLLKSYNIELSSKQRKTLEKSKSDEILITNLKQIVPNLSEEDLKKSLYYVKGAKVNNVVSNSATNLLSAGFGLATNDLIKMSVSKIESTEMFNNIKDRLMEGHTREMEVKDFIDEASNKAESTVKSITPDQQISPNFISNEISVEDELNERLKGLIKDGYTLDETGHLVAPYRENGQGGLESTVEEEYFAQKWNEEFDNFKLAKETSTDIQEPQIEPENKIHIAQNDNTIENNKTEDFQIGKHESNIETEQTNSLNEDVNESVSIENNEKIEPSINDEELNFYKNHKAEQVKAYEELDKERNQAQNEYNEIEQKIKELETSKSQLESENAEYSKITAENRENIKLASQHDIQLGIYKDVTSGSYFPGYNKYDGLASTINTIEDGKVVLNNISEGRRTWSFDNLAEEEPYQLNVLRNKIARSFFTDKEAKKITDGNFYNHLPRGFENGSEARIEIDVRINQAMAISELEKNGYDVSVAREQYNSLMNDTYNVDMSSEIKDEWIAKSNEYDEYVPTEKPEIAAPILSENEMREITLKHTDNAFEISNLEKEIKNLKEQLVENNKVIDDIELTKSELSEIIAKDTKKIENIEAAQEQLISESLEKESEGNIHAENSANIAHKEQPQVEQVAETLSTEDEVNNNLKEFINNGYTLGFNIGDEIKSEKTNLNEFDAYYDAHFQDIQRMADKDSLNETYKNKQPEEKPKAFDVSNEQDRHSVNEEDTILQEESIAQNVQETPVVSNQELLKELSTNGIHEAMTNNLANMTNDQKIAYAQILNDSIRGGLKHSYLESLSESQLRNVENIIDAPDEKKVFYNWENDKRFEDLSYSAKSAAAFDYARKINNQDLQQIKNITPEQSEEIIKTFSTIVEKDPVFIQKFIQEVAKLPETTVESELNIPSQENDFAQVQDVETQSDMTFNEENLNASDDFENIENDYKQEDIKPHETTSTQEIADENQIKITSFSTGLEFTGENIEKVNNFAKYVLSNGFNLTRNSNELVLVSENELQKRNIAPGDNISTILRCPPDEKHKDFYDQKFYVAEYFKELKQELNERNNQNSVENEKNNQNSVEKNPKTLSISDSDSDFVKLHKNFVSKAYEKGTLVPQFGYRNAKSGNTVILEGYKFAGAEDYVTNGSQDAYLNGITEQYIDDPDGNKIKNPNYNPYLYKDKGQTILLIKETIEKDANGVASKNKSFIKIPASQYAEQIKNSLTIATAPSLTNEIVNKYEQNAMLDEKKQRENTAENFTHNYKAFCRKHANNPQEAVDFASRLIKEMIPSEREKLRKTLLHYEKVTGMSYNTKLVEDYKNNVSDLTINNVSPFSDKTLTSIVSSTEVYTLKGKPIDKSCKLAIGDSINISLSIPDALGKRKMKLPAQKLKVVSFSSDNNSVVLMDEKGTSKYVLPRDTFVKNVQKMEKKQQKQMNRREKEESISM